MGGQADLPGKCKIEETAHDMTGNLGAQVSGKVLLISFSINPALLYVYNKLTFLSGHV